MFCFSNKKCIFAFAKQRQHLCITIIHNKKLTNMKITASLTLTYGHATVTIENPTTAQLEYVKDTRKYHYDYNAVYKRFLKLFETNEAIKKWELEVVNVSYVKFETSFKLQDDGTNVEFYFQENERGRIFDSSHGHKKGFDWLSIMETPKFDGLVKLYLSQKES